MTINISVDELLAFTVRSGDANSGAGFGRIYQSTAKGQALRRLVKKKSGDSYQTQVPLEGTLSEDGLIYLITGSADGIIETGNGIILDEIRSTTRELYDIDPDLYPEYTARAECCAWMAAKARGLTAVTVRLTFVNSSSGELEHFESRRTLPELEAAVLLLLVRYRKWAILRRDSEAELRESAKKMKFPYKSYRKGQSDMILECFGAIKRRETLFCEAPTGIGKTLSVCYASFKALGEGIGRRIFYFTPKTTVGAAPLSAVSIMKKHGLRARVTLLSAKERCCFCREALGECSGSVCEYSFGHHERVLDALYRLVSENTTITPDITAEYARRHRVCPYELSLDAAMLSDMVICDCSYLFDPTIYQKRFFGEGCGSSENIGLIDEAHELVDRSRGMYSKVLRTEELETLIRIIHENDYILYSPLKKLYDELSALSQLCEESLQPDGDILVGAHVSHEPFTSLCEAAGEFASAAFEWLRRNKEAYSSLTIKISDKKEISITKAVADAAFAALGYTRAVDRAGDKYLHLAEIRGERAAARLLCLDPSEHIREKLKALRAAIFFSATLTPIDYYTDLLGGSDASVLRLPSPFEHEHLFVGIMDRISMRYADRDSTIDDVVEIIDTAVSAKPGNYLVFLPSYAMLKKTASAYKRIACGVRVIAQKRDMSISDRDLFLSLFYEGGATVGFAVLGGVFSESIDLTGEKLIGTVIVGCGLARINTEDNILAEYFRETREMGFEYAYQYPAMNRVLQAVGRVIRSDTDIGVCILIDDRYSSREWSRLFPEHMRPLRLIGDPYSLGMALDRFWNSMDNGEDSD